MVPFVALLKNWSREMKCRKNEEYFSRIMGKQSV